MPRKKRYTQLYSCHHVIFRGNAGRLIFLDTADRIRFCLMLQKAVEEHQLLVHAFCLMSNHAHFIFEPTASSLSIAVHAFAFRYAQYFNRRHELYGHLFQDRFRSISIEDDVYLKQVVRYIHLNPIRANLVSLPQDYKWSSFSSYMNLDTITWITLSRILQKFAANEMEAREALVRHMAQTIEAELDASIIQKPHQIGVFSEEELIKNFYSFKAYSPRLGIEFADLITVAEEAFKYKKSEICSIDRKKYLVDIRSILALAVYKVPGLHLQQLATYLNRDSSSLSRLVARATKIPDFIRKSEELIELTYSKSRE